jgi:TonB family protein
MKRSAWYGMLILSVFLCCCRRAPLRNLVVTHITHFVVQGDGSSLNLPVFAGTLSVDQIVRDVTLAEYYQKKLAAVYKFQSFTLQEGASSEILLDREGDLKQPQKILRYEDSTSVMEIRLTSFGRGIAQYTFRVSDRAEQQLRDHAVDVPSGKSASIGTMFDQRKGIGHLVVISMRSLAVSQQTTPAELAAFLREKNSLPADTTSARYVGGDQKWMDEIFGPGKMELPLEKTTARDSISDRKLVAFDTAPALIGALDVTYPASAKRDSVQGQVVVELYISKTGRVENCRVKKSLRADVDSAAVDAVRRAKFTPATYKGDAIGVIVAIPIVFKLQ